MMTTQRPERKARTVALIGLGLQVGLVLLFAVLTVWSHSEALRGLTYLTAVGAWVWLFLILVFHQRVLVQEEAFETEQLRRERAGKSGTDAIFDVADEELLLARRRLQWMYRWLLPGVTIVIIVSLIRAGISGWSWTLGGSLSGETWQPIAPGNVGLLIWFVIGGTLVSFLFSRYATGLARQPEWRMLHAGAAYLMGVTLSSAVVAAALAILHFAGTPTPEHVLAHVLRFLLLVLAAETLLNFVLDFYRPRGPDEEPRPAFDSRLLGLFTEPGGIARSIAEAINYQFGFEVSSTWFYKLLQRSVVPLICFALVTLLAATCLVFVGAQERTVVERFGAYDRTLAGGLHFKLPWPLEIAYDVPIELIGELKIGDPGTQDEQELILWTNKHSREPHLEVLVAAPKLARFLLGEEGEDTGTEQRRSETARTRPAGGRAKMLRSEAVPVSQLRVSLVLQYRIRDAYHWLRSYSDPKTTLRAIAERQVMRYSAGAEVADLLGGDRAGIEKALAESIVEAVRERNLGVDIIFVGLQGVHPPADTAKAFQNVIGAVSKAEASVKAAEANYNKRLAEVAGDVGRAEALARAIVEMNRAEADPEASAEAMTAARAEAHRLFLGDATKSIRQVGGLAAETLARAREEQWRLENRAQGEEVGFGAEILTKNAAPKVYWMRRYLETLAEATGGIRKYVIATAEGSQSVQSYQLNIQDTRDILAEAALDKKD